MAPPNTTDTTYLDTQLDAMTAQLAVLSFAPTTVTSALTARFPSLDSSVFANLADTLSHSRKLSGLVNNDSSEKLSHHIKFDKEPPSPLSYCDVIYDNKTKQCTLLLKMDTAQKFEGSFKRATKQIAIQIDPDTGLRFCPVVGLKAKDDSLANRFVLKTQANIKSVIEEATNEGALKFKCESGSDPRGNTRTEFNRLGRVRAVQLDKGITVKNAMENAMKTDTDNAQKKEEALLSNLCHYMKQIGFQLAQMHRNGHTHFDVKPDNILVRPGEVTRDGQTTAPIYTLIDIPDKKIDPAEKMNKSFEITSTARYSPPCRGRPRPSANRMIFLKKLCLTEDQLGKFKELAGVLPAQSLYGHMFDSYAFLIGFGEQIAEFDAKRNIEDFKPFQDFFVAQMDLYLDAALAIARGKSKKWPENLTVSGITQSFTEMIRTNEKCQDKAFLEQAIENAEARNQIPSQPFNTTGVLPKDATKLPVATLLTTSTSTPESNKLAIENLSSALEKLKTQQLQNIQDHTQIYFWMMVWDFITSGFSTNSMNYQQAKNILVDFCEKNEKEVDVTRVIAALTFIEEKKMVREPSALVTLVSVINHLRETQASNPSKDIIRPSVQSVKTNHHSTLDELGENLGKKHDSTENRHKAFHGVDSPNTKSQQGSNDPSLSQKK